MQVEEDVELAFKFHGLVDGAVQQVLLHLRPRDLANLRCTSTAWRNDVDRCLAAFLLIDAAPGELISNAATLCAQMKHMHLLLTSKPLARIANYCMISACNHGVGLLQTNA
eukprot:1159343-Pelagomonas_calceolata.AAC.11